MIRRMGWILAFVLTVGLTVADTFIPKTGGSALHGYLTSQTEGQKTVVMTQEQGRLSVNLSDYKIQPDSQGRQPHVALISIPGQIELEMETAAFEKAVVEEADRGPLCIIIEIDSPGGRVDLVKRMCSALSSVKYLPDRGLCPRRQARRSLFGRSGGCDGLSEIVYGQGHGHRRRQYDHSYRQTGPMDLKKVLGEEVGEKMNSAWRNYVGSLAELNNRPGLLAKAMVDPDIAVVEILQNGKRQFVEPFNQQTGDKVIKTWSRKGSLLTLTAMEAVQCGIADGTAASRDELLGTMKAASAPIQENGRTAEARKQFEDIVKRFNKINDSLDLRIHRLGTFANTVPRAQVLKTYQGVTQEIRALIRMVQTCPDLPYSQEDLQAALNVVQAQYDAIRMAR